MPATSTLSPTGTPIVDGVLSGTKWAVTNFTYSFPTSGSFYEAGYGSGEPTNRFEAFNAAQQAATRTILSSYSAVANLSFTEITESSSTHADLRFAESDAPGTAWAYYPTTRAEGGDTWLNNSKNYYDNPVKGGYAYTTILHEIGHAMGLKHAHEASGSFAAMPSNYDSMEYSVMSYRSYTGGSTTAGYTNETWGYAQSLMQADIAALQKMYGANFTTNSGNTTYAWNSSTGEMSINGIGQGAPGGNKVFATVWDGGGIDTYNFSNYSTNLTVSLEPGAWSTISTIQLAKLHYDGSKVAVGNIANALQYNNDARSLIENATGGSGGDILTGNIAANVLTGGAGDDRLTGGAGSDRLEGGTGTDTAVFSGSRSQYSITTLSDGSIRVADLRTGAPDGIDTVVGVESFQFADKVYSAAELGATTTTTTTTTTTPTTPTTTNQTLTGDAGDNTLVGGSGNDTLDGGAGNDILEGRAGADKLVGGTGTDTASYASATAGVIADLTYASKNTGEAKGDTYSAIENLTGSAFADTLSGNSYANVLEGGGGADKLVGGSGIDTASYAGAKAGVTADLTSAANNRGDAAGDTFSSIENLTGSAFADNLVGNSSVNVLTGGEGNDTLDGRSGNDTLYGGGGDDVLIGGAGADTLDGGAGIDMASYATATSSVIADLTTTSGSRGDAYNDKFINVENLTGSAYADTLKGNAAANVLTGGAGADKLYGKEGNDTLVGGAGNDTLDGGAGTDVAVYSGAISDYRQVQNADGSWTITDLRSGSPDGIDTLFGIETLRFGAPASTASGGAEELDHLDEIPFAQVQSDSFDFSFFRPGKMSAGSNDRWDETGQDTSFKKSVDWISIAYNSTHVENGLQLDSVLKHHISDDLLL